MTKKTEIKTTRKPYHKPQLTQVKLIPEEAALTNCKVVGSNGPNSGSNDCYRGSGAGTSPCSAQGS